MAFDVMGADGELGAAGGRRGMHRFPGSAALPCLAGLLAAVWLPFMHPPPAAAEEPGDPAPGAGARQLDELVVTGTRILRSDVTGSSPIVRAEAGDLAAQGAVRVEDMLRTLPQVVANENAGRSYYSTGTATLNLRGLGAARTLVLVNGRRLPAGSPVPGGMGADLNQVPAVMVDTVDVLTGGASATYGSDAVAGVVNFRLRDDVEGVHLQYQFSQYQHANDGHHWQRIAREAGHAPADGPVWDGQVSDAALIAGTGFGDGRGHASAYVTFRDVEPVSWGDRDYSSCALVNGLTECAGSATQPRGTFADFGLLREHGREGLDVQVEGDRFVPRAGTVYNFAPPNYFQRSDRRWTAGLLARHDVRDRSEAYTELQFMDDRTVAQMAPSGTFFHPDTLGCGNPFLSGQQFQVLCGRYGLTPGDEQSIYVGRRSVESGNRQDHLRHASYRGVVGLRGDLADRWQYDLHVQRARVSMRRTFLNDLSKSRIRRALDAVRHPDTGEIVCRSALDGSDPDCVPWNIFREDGVTQPMVDYLSLPLSATGATGQTVVSGHVTADFGDYGFRLPHADEGPRVVWGGEHRREYLRYDPDAAFRNDDGAGQGGANKPVDGTIEVSELFVEASLPLAHGAAYADALVLDGGYRHSAYGDGVDTDTFGVRASWAVNAGLRMRASMQRAMRAPNVRERFLPQGFNLFDMDPEPCAGPVAAGRTAAGRTLEECMRSGVTAAQFGHIEPSPANQYNVLEGGSTDLVPEESDTFAYGLIWTPAAVPGFTVGIDHYAIEIRKGISTVQPELILNQCLDGNLPQCAKVRRGRGGDLWLGSDLAQSGHIVSVLANLTVEQVRGYDLTASYRFGVGEWGRLHLRDVLSVTTAASRQALAGAAGVDCAGRWGATCGAPTPELRNHFRMTWLTPWRIHPSLAWRYIDRVEDVNAAGVDLDARHYVDLSAVWDYSETANLRIGINNLFDRAPPVAGLAAGPTIFGNGNTFPGLYDSLGRYLFAALRVALP